MLQPPLPRLRLPDRNRDALSHAHGWSYSYNDNGDVETKTDGVDSYSFTYTRELKVKTISLNTQVLHTFGYDANGSRVAERWSDGTLVFFVGGYYEYSVKGSETHTTKYYGSEVLRVDDDVRYILTDHGNCSAVAQAAPARSRMGVGTTWVGRAFSSPGRWMRSRPFNDLEQDRAGASLCPALSRLARR